MIPTVHPRGDRRIVRCAQVALDAGFRVHFVWLGDGYDQSQDSAVGETLVRQPRTARERLGRLVKIRRLAEELNGEVWHIHDFYFLGQALRWRKRSHHPVLYDVHEYYADYYSEKLPLPSWGQRLVAKILEGYQVRVARRLGAANVVAEAMAPSFRRAGVPVAVSPNYPLLAHFGAVPSRPFSERRWNVVHTGTLTSSYGTEFLVQIARRSLERGLPFEFTAIGRFPSIDHERAFDSILADAGTPTNLHIVPPRPTHEIPSLLSDAGFGLSLITATRQNEAAIASKSFEYVIAGLVNVVTDRRAQSDFVREHAVSVIGDEESTDAMLDEMLELAENADQTDITLADKAASARRLFTWEQAVEPGLSSLLKQLRPPVS
ncbi:glycosyltransferase [Microbacterium sp. USTB-Y]|uniref:glycosyltransferase n=1 Tax=Microbacterium sp. USTB-Y TaxID=2823692 RepID=UPI00203A9F3B|nr:glycosyltransferase [Microbacterium sp. USTB-Y]